MSGAPSPQAIACSCWVYPLNGARARSPCEGMKAETGPSGSIACRSAAGGRNHLRSLQAGILPFSITYEWRVFRRRISSAACASSHSRNIVILGSAEVAFGQTIQYVLETLRETSIGLTRRPLMRSQAASAVRASATPWPSTAASISMLARFRTGP